MRTPNPLPPDARCGCCRDDERAANPVVLSESIDGSLCARHARMLGVGFEVDDDCDRTCEPNRHASDCPRGVL